ncbi:unnamed protein product [Tilletia caries]|nr:unnamed protein product [Tilletia caries]
MGDGQSIQILDGVLLLHGGKATASASAGYTYPFATDSSDLLFLNLTTPIPLSAPPWQSLASPATAFFLTLASFSRNGLALFGRQDSLVSTPSANDSLYLLDFSNPAVLSHLTSREQGRLQVAHPSQGLQPQCPQSRPRRSAGYHQGQHHIILPFKLSNQTRADSMYLPSRSHSVIVLSAIGHRAPDSQSCHGLHLQARLHHLRCEPRQCRYRHDLHSHVHETFGTRLETLRTRAPPSDESWTEARPMAATTRRTAPTRVCCSLGGASAGGADNHGTHHIEDTLGFAHLETLPLLRDQSHRIDPADSIPLGIPLPTPNHHTAAQIRRLLIFLASLPAHPANPNTSHLAYAIAQLAEVRAEYLLGSAKFLGSRVREYAVGKIVEYGR